MTRLICWIFSTLIIHMSSGTITEIELTEACGKTYDYEIYDVTDTVSYHVTFSGTDPPKRCRRGFYRGYGAETCVEAIEYDVQDCDIKLHFSSDVLKTYSCNLQPGTRICTYAGDILKITLSTKYPRKTTYKNSSFKLLVTQGKVKEDSSITPIAIIMPIMIISLVLVISCSIIAYKRRQQQQQEALRGIARNLNTTTLPQQPQTHVVVYHHVVPQQGGGAFSSSNPQRPFIAGQGQQINIHQYPANSEQMPLQGYGQHMSSGQFDPSQQRGDKSSSDPPPSYEEAKNYIV